MSVPKAWGPENRRKFQIDTTVHVTDLLQIGGLILVIVVWGFGVERRIALSESTAVRLEQRINEEKIAREAQRGEDRTATDQGFAELKAQNIRISDKLDQIRDRVGAKVTQ